jgi:hypothetical protein
MAKKIAFAIGIAKNGKKIAFTITFCLNWQKIRICHKSCHKWQNYSIGIVQITKQGHTSMHTIMSQPRSTVVSEGWV